MAAEDVINLDPGSDEDALQPENNENTNPQEIHVIQEEGEVGQADDSNVEDMDLGDDIVVSKQSVSHASTELVASGSTSVTVIKSSSDIVLIDQSPTIGVERTHVECTENEPSVRVVFRSLTRESKRKLMELMQQWSEWQAKHPSSSSSTETKEEALECGEETYYPALHVGSSKSEFSVMSFWIDNQARTDNVKDESSVPLYDREFTLGSSSLDGSASFERSVKDYPRCFNCGSYSHPMKECPKPRDMATINNARNQHNAKKNLTNANHRPSRYYQRKPGKFDDLKPGVLGPETRECLGIGEFDPPPWLHRMREMGYPPGYLEVVEDKNKPSGIMIFTDKEEKDGSSDKKVDYEDGELPDRSAPGSPEKIMTVEIPGINAPIPEKADPFLWSVNPPCAPAPTYLPRYNPYDRSQSPMPGRYHPYDRSRSPILSRSLSAVGSYDGSLSHTHGHSPLSPSPRSSYSYPYQYSTSDVPMYHARGRERERERDRDRDRDMYDDRRQYHHRR